MTRDQFILAARRVKWTGLIAISGIFLSTFLAFGIYQTEFNLVIQESGDILRKHFSENVADLAFAISLGLFIGGVFVGPIALALFFINRLWGLRCPACRRYVTIRCLPADVLLSGHCTFCQTKLFEGGDEGL